MSATEAEIQGYLDTIASKIAASRAVEGYQLNRKDMLYEVYELFTRLPNYHYRLRSDNGKYDLEIQKFASSKIKIFVTFSMIDDGVIDTTPENNTLPIEDCPLAAIRFVYNQRYNILKKLSEKSY